MPRISLRRIASRLIALASLFWCSNTASAQFIEGFEDPSELPLYDQYRPLGSGWVSNFSYAASALHDGMLGAKFYHPTTPGKWCVRNDMNTFPGNAYYAMIQFPAAFSGEAWFGVCASAGGAIVARAEAGAHTISLYRLDGWQASSPVPLSDGLGHSAVAGYTPASPGWFRLQVRWQPTSLPNPVMARAELLNEAGTAFLAATIYVNVGAPPGTGILIRGNAVAAPPGVSMDSIALGNCPVPTITTDLPPQQEVCLGALAHFSVVATTTLGPLAYELLRGTEPVAAGSAPNFNYGPLVPSDFSSQFSVRVTSPCGMATSSSVSLTQLEPPVITIPPDNVVRCDNSGTTLSVSATGSPPITYAWAGPGIVGRSDGPSVFASLPGSYQCLVTNPCSTAGAYGFLTWLNLQITTQPSDVLACDGSQASVWLVAQDATQYQWYKDSQLVIDDDRINGATTATLHFLTCIVSDEGQYQCYLSNQCDSQSSDTVTLRVRSRSQFQR